MLGYKGGGYVPKKFSEYVEKLMGKKTRKPRRYQSGSVLNLRSRAMNEEPVVVGRKLTEKELEMARKRGERNAAKALRGVTRKSKANKRMAKLMASERRRANRNAELALRGELNLNENVSNNAYLRMTEQERANLNLRRAMEGTLNVSNNNTQKWMKKLQSRKILKKLGKLQRQRREAANKRTKKQMPTHRENNESESNSSLSNLMKNFGTLGLRK